MQQNKAVKQSDILFGLLTSAFFGWLQGGRYRLLGRLNQAWWWHQRALLWVWVLRFLVMFASVAAWPVAAQEADFLAPEEAFEFSVFMAASDVVQVNYRVAPGYYLYRERFAFALKPAGMAELGTVVFPDGTFKYDSSFEKSMEVYEHAVSVRVPVRAAGQPITLSVIAQGCADKGICYPPLATTIELLPVAGGYEIASTSEHSTVALLPDFPETPLAGMSFEAAPRLGPENLKVDPRAGPEVSLTALAETNDVSVAALMSRLGGFRTAAIFLGLGVLLALTPCFLPMLPILSALVVGAREGRFPSWWSGLGLAASYVLGMSLVYTALGVVAGLTGEGLAAWLQTPWMVVLFAILLAVLALAMFDVLTFQAPLVLQNVLTKWGARCLGGRATGVFLMGVVSALVVGPCVAAPLAGALLYISQTGDVVLGAVALFALAWGMGLPLLVMGASAGQLLPKPGPWMKSVKYFLGLLLLGTAWWMVSPLLSPSVQMLGWAGLSLVVAVMLQTFEALPAGAHIRWMFAKGLGWWLVLIAVMWVIGAASGGREVLRPLASFVARGRAITSWQASNVGRAEGMALSLAPTAGVQFESVRSVAELNDRLATATRPVLLDIYADWCVACREMEQLTLAHPTVAQYLPRLRWLRADVTANNAEDRALLRRFRLFGPPAILFFDSEGQEHQEARVIGFQNADRFVQALNQIVP
jgi:thiol:disulfide interchange protein DsbD